MCILYYALVRMGRSSAVSLDRRRQLRESSGLMSRLLSLLGLAVLLSTACGSKEIGELCEDDSECRTDRCSHASVPAASGTKQCTAPCTGGCPDGSICVNEMCMQECDPGAPDCAEDTVCDPYFKACFGACSSSDQCAGGTCTEQMLCE